MRRLASCCLFALILMLARAAGAWADATVAGPGPNANPLPQPSPTPTLKVHGFVDGYYLVNFNGPPNFGPQKNSPGVAPAYADPVGENTPSRNFDVQSGHLALAEAKLSLERSQGPVGFHLDLIGGQAALIMNNAEPAGGHLLQFVQQGYLIVPIKSRFGDHVDIGKFLAPDGAEAFDSKDNFNYSHSLLFTWAVPYYHFGARYTHYFNADQSRFFQIFLVNGWNDVKDNNGAKTVGVSLGFRLNPSLTLVQNLTVGGEPVDNPVAPTSNGTRFLSDTVVTWTVNPRLTLLFNADYGTQANTRTVTGTSGAGWYGAAATASYQLDPKQALALRVEFFNDPQGFATGFRQAMNEVTLTYGYRPSPNVLWRIEARRDGSSAPVFYNSSGLRARSGQTTVSASVVLSF